MAIYCKHCSDIALVRLDQDEFTISDAIQCVQCGATLTGAPENSPLPQELQQDAPPPAPQNCQPVAKNNGGAVAAKSPSRVSKDVAAILKKCPNCGLEVDEAYVQASGSRDCPFCGFSHKERMRAHAAGKAQEMAIYEHITPSELFSLDHVLELGGRRCFLALCLLVLGLAPIGYSYLARGAEVQTLYWFFTSYFSLIWGMILHYLIKPRNVLAPVVIGVCLFTILIGITGLLLAHHLPLVKQVYALTNSPSLAMRLTGYIFGVGLCEELVKALPIVLLIRMKLIKEPESACFYGAVSGLAFSVSEGVEYSFRYATGLIAQTIRFDTFLLAHMVRYITLPLAHAAFAGLACYFIGLSTYNARLFPVLFTLGLGASALLHGVYDTFCSGILGLVILGITIALFCLFVFKSSDLADRMESIARAQTNPERS